MDNNLLQEIGKRIQLRRKDLGYTQEQLAELMNVSIQMVSNLERGNKAIRIDNLINLSQILKVSTDYILKGFDYTTQDMAENLSKRDRNLLEQIIIYCREHPTE